MTTSQYHSDVRAYLASNAGLNVPLKEGPLRSSFDDDVVTVKSSGGQTQPYHNGGSENANQPTVKILVRGHHSAFDQTDQRARDIHDLMKSAQLPGYDGAWVEQAGPIGPMPDGDGRWVFTINIRLLIDE